MTSAHGLDKGNKVPNMNHPLWTLIERDCDMEEESEVAEDEWEDNGDLDG